MICQKCDKEFTTYAVIDGKIRNLCKRKYCLECSPFGGFNRRKLYKEELLESIKCNHCNNDLPTKLFYYRRSRRTYQTTCKNCLKVNYHSRSLNFKQQCVDYKGGKCQVCEYDKCLSALEFHHIDGKSKEFILAKGYRYGFGDKVKAELDKCHMLCANCHREHHHNERLQDAIVVR